MAQHLLVTRPNHDYATRYLSVWAGKFFNTAKEKGLSVVDLYRERANREEVESVLQKRDPGLIVINGHGDDNLVTGHENKVLISTKINSYLLRGKITYAISCRSARVLGKEVGQYDNTTYIGYNDDFVFIYLEEYRTQPAEDKLAKLFLDPSNLIITTLLKGHPTKEAVLRARQDFLKKIQRLITSKVAAEESSVLRYLVWDMRNLTLCGKDNKRLPGKK